MNYLGNMKPFRFVRFIVSNPTVVFCILQIRYYLWWPFIHCGLVFFLSGPLMILIIASVKKEWLVVSKRPFKWIYVFITFSSTRGLFAPTHWAKSSEYFWVWFILNKISERVFKIYKVLEAQSTGLTRLKFWISDLWSYTWDLFRIRNKYFVKISVDFDTVGFRIHKIPISAVTISQSNFFLILAKTNVECSSRIYTKCPQKYI